MSTAIDDYLDSITSTAQTIFTSTTYAIDQLALQTAAVDDPFNRDALSTTYPVDDIRSSALNELSEGAYFSGTGDLSGDTSVDIANSYLKRTVEQAQSDLTAHVVGAESSLTPVEAYQPKIGDLTSYANQIDELVDKALAKLRTLPNALTNVFAENITTYHHALWQSGFLTAVRNISADDIQGSIESRVGTHTQAAISLISSQLLSGLNLRGFTLPSQMVDAAIAEADLLGSHMTTDIQRKIDLAAAKITQRLFDLGINAEQLQEGFTKSANSMELELDKVRYAAAEAQVQGSIELLRGNIDGLSGFIRAYINAVELPAEWLTVEERKLEATRQQSRSWKQWTEAVTSAQKLIAMSNDIHFTEVDNNLQLAETVDRLDKMKAGLIIEKTDAEIRNQIAGKEGELVRNAAQQDIYAAKIRKASILMRRADAELKAYISDFTSQYTAAMSAVQGGDQLSDLATLSGKLLGQIVNESQINVTSNKVT